MINLFITKGKSQKLYPQDSGTEMPYFHIDVCFSLGVSKLTEI